MKILLVKPFNTHSYSFVPPIGLGYLASVLKKGGHEVLLYEAVRDKISSIEPFKDYIKEHQPQMIGIQTYSADLHIVEDYLNITKQFNQSIYTVLGGPHPAADPEGTMDYYGKELLNFCIAGEAELGMLELANHLDGRGGSLSDVAGLIWRDETGAYNKNAKRLVDNIDEIPWPDWGLIRPDKYPQAPLGGIAKNFPIGPIMVSRGCPLKCTFCAAKSVYGLGFRFRNIDDVISEIRYLKEEFGVKEIMIQDDNITFKKSVLLEFCEKIKPLNIPWNCSNGIRLDMVNDQVAQAMADSGCYLVAVGIESGSQKILDDMKKKIKKERIAEKINFIAKYGIRVTGLFIIGYPTETREDVLETIEFAKSLNISTAAFSNFLPLPGSPIYDQLKEEGKLDGLDLGGMHYYGANRSFTPHMTVDELNDLIKLAVRSFHLRPKIIFDTIKRSGSLSNLAHLGRRFIENYV